jgi:creatine kinase
VDISPSARFCISEAEIVTALYNGIKLLKAAEDEAGGSSSADPAAILAKIHEIKKSHPDNIAMACFEQEYYDSLDDEKKARFLRCLASGYENADSGMGCYACYVDDYEVFKPFFTKALESYHKVDLSKKKHVNNWSLEGVEGLPADGKLDLTKLGLPPLSMRVRTGRNLSKFPLPGAMTQEDRVNMELAMGKVFEQLIAKDGFGGKYVSITPGHANFIDEAEYQEYVKAHIMFKDMSADSYLLSAGIARDWPHGRGCYVSEDKQFIVWVGEEDHLRIMCMKKGAVLNEVFDRLKTAVDLVEELVEGGCAKHADFGVVTSCPTNIGTGMRASVHIALPNLTADGTDAKAKKIAKPLGLSVRGLGGEHTPIGADGTVDISPSARFCISEAEIVTALYNGIKLLKAAEDEAGDEATSTGAEEETEEKTSGSAVLGTRIPSFLSCLLFCSPFYL